MPPICGRYPPSLPRIAQRFLSCSRQDLEAFFADRAESGLAANSAARKLSCLKRFMQFLVAEGLRADDPARLIDGAKARRSLPATLSIAEVDLLLDCGPRSGRIGNSGRAAARAASRLPSRTPLRDGIARLGTGGPAAQRAQGRPDDADGQGQGRARAHPALEPEGARHPRQMA